MNPVEQKVVNAIRVLSIEAVEKANSGHPGLPMGAAAMGYALWSGHLKHSAKNPEWIDRDRFVLSAGHGSMLQYSLLHLFGYDVSLDDLKNFRQWGSKTPGHPEFRMTPGVEATTGPLGQGFANGVGMAIAESFLARTFNREGLPIIDHYTYVLHGDGCLMEGISYEAASLAGRLGLGKLIALYDSNGITIEGSTQIAFTEDIAMRFRAMNWQVLSVEDGNDIDAIRAAVEEGKKQTEQPTIIIAKTRIGYGCPKIEGTHKAHGEPLGADNICDTKDYLGWSGKEPFQVPDEVYAYMDTQKAQAEARYAGWLSMWETYRQRYSEDAARLERWMNNEFTLDEDQLLGLMDGKPSATRADGGLLLNKLADMAENLVGGSADLNPSTKTYLNGKGDYDRETAGRNIHFGIREHAMGAIANGIAYHGGLRPFVSTFFVFSDYMKPPVRVAALSELPVLYMFTHDSIGVGEDGPTHQPIEHLAALRSLPGLVVFRPADRRETMAGLVTALRDTSRPYAMVLTRQNNPQLEKSSGEAAKGAYIVYGSADETPELILLASGSEVAPACAAAAQLAENGVKVRVLSIPSFELFDEQDESYRAAMLPPSVRKRIAVEAASGFGWERYTGLDGAVVAINTFGASAKADKIFSEYGINTENIMKTAKKLLSK